MRGGSDRRSGGRDSIGLGEEGREEEEEEEEEEEGGGKYKGFALGQRLGKREEPPGCPVCCLLLDPPARLHWLVKTRGCWGKLQECTYKSGFQISTHISFSYPLIIVMKIRPDTVPYH